MKILHGTWIPSTKTDFIQLGAFYLWIEVPSSENNSIHSGQIHPGHLAKNKLSNFLSQQLGFKESIAELNQRISPKYFALPTLNQQPLPAPELVKYLEIEIPDDYEELQYWQVDCYQMITNTKVNSPAINVIRLLNDLHFLSLYNSGEFQLGCDLLFWYHYTQAFKQVILKDQYIPALKYIPKEAPPKKGKSRQTVLPQFEIYPTWEIISEEYNANIERYVDYMPLICTAGVEIPGDRIDFFNPETLLRHFSEYILQDLITHTPSTAAFDQKITDSLIHYCLYPQEHQPLTGNADFSLYQQWLAWKTKINRTQADCRFYICFQLNSPAPEEDEDQWEIQFLVASKQDPSLKMALADYWRISEKGELDAESTTISYLWEENFTSDLLLNLGYAARMYPLLWRGLETDCPSQMQLTLEEAFAFLQESAWVLEDAGFKVIVPSWYTPEGRRRAKMRLKASMRQKSGKSPTKSEKKSYFGLDSLVKYEYQLAIGDEVITPQEWEELINAKSPLVQFRGQWMELDKDKMQQLLQFWQVHGNEQPEMSVLDFLHRQAEIEEDWEIEHDRALSEMMDKLQDKSKLEIGELDVNIQGNLREYQKRGVGWLEYLEFLGLNGCLADDMGLGKSVQVIARLVQEKDSANDTLPTLLIAPTSVVGNWQREILKFAPQLTTLVHHGSDRQLDPVAFKAICEKTDVVITSFTLVRKDEKLLNAVKWQRLVLDEAQNIKNPQAAQTKAILKISAKHRLALTGTPVENRLLDLWSIFNFLNPGYLGKQTQFRKSFEIPIQKDHDRVKSVTLKKLVEPLILRRLKTDASIIKDLPDKVEQKIYTNLTQEQASLYEVVVKDVEEKLETVAEGIGRKGLILSTLLKLKQICNHPAQFLQDNSEFSGERSHKLSRLMEMVDEAISEGESVLIFSQFTEICQQVEKYLKQQLRCHTYYLHGGTNRKRREQMIEEFQHPETEASVFILSLKAGGVGITLTKANHVFHFDRWWNPAVENQATDRAFRIGQKKNVFVHKFLTIGTIEEKIDQMITDKQQLSTSVVGSDESWLTELDNEAFKQLIALNKNAILE